MNFDVNNIIIRQLTIHDVASLLTLEKKAWPLDVQASEEILYDRISTFKEGAFGAFLDDLMIGAATSQIIRYHDNEMLRSWESLTKRGWISKTHDSGGNCIHFVSVGIHPQYRNYSIAKQLNEARLQLAKNLNLDYALTDTRLPGLKQFLSEDSSRDASTYIEKIIEGKIIEPVVSMYLHLGFHPLGLIFNCMNSDIESLSFGLAMLKNIG